MVKLRLNGKRVYYKVSTYMESDRIALLLEDEDHAPYGVVTVNIPELELKNNNCSFIDINNMGVEILDWLEINNFGKCTGAFGTSGFCMYPEFEFNEEIIKEKIA